MIKAEDPIKDQVSLILEWKKVHHAPFSEMLFDSISFNSNL